MEAKAYQRRATGEMAIDPALRQLVLHTGALLDRLICARGLPIPEAPPAPATLPAPALLLRRGGDPRH
jgi:hypothetical protein